MARQPDVVRQVGRTKRHADGAVLGENHALLVDGKLRETSAPPQRIPHGPPPGRIEHRSARTLEERVEQIRLVAERVRAADHRVLGLLHERRKRRSIQQRPDAIEEESGILAEREQGDAARVVHVFVQHA